MALTMLAPWDAANDAAATAANTGFGSVIKTDTDATMLFKKGSGAWMPRNKPSIEFLGTTTPGYVLGVLEAPAPSDQVGLDIPWDVLELPNAEQAVVSLHSADDTRLWSFAGFASGAVAVRDAAAATRWTAAGASPASVLAVAHAPYILRIFVTRDATAGSFRVQLVNEADGTVIANGDTGLRTAQNTGAAPITHAKISAKSASASVVPAKYRFGVPRYDWAATGLLPLWTPPVAHKPARYSTGSAWATAHDVVYSDGTAWRSFFGEG